MPYIKPRIVVVDETEYWADDLAAQVGKIYGVYLYDENRVVHCCELTPSYELNALEVAILNWETCPEIVRDDIESEWWRGTEPISYFHAHTVDGWDKFLLPTQRCKAEDYDDYWEEILEYYQANPPHYRLPVN